jgi:coenzyme F420-reducing hydrogenase alpha subunit
VIPASGHDNLAMKRSVLQVTQQYVDGGWWTADGTKLSEDMLNRVGAMIRAYDVCLARE